MRSRNSKYFVDRIPDNVQASYCPVALKGQYQSSTLIGNSTTVQYTPKPTGEQLAPMYRRKKYLHTYTMARMDEIEFAEAQFSMNDLISEYQQYQDASAAHNTNYI